MNATQRRNLLFGFMCMVHHNPEAGTGGGGSKTIEQKLTDATNQVTTLTGERDKALADKTAAENNLTAMTSERDRIKSQFDNLTTTATETTNKLTSAQNEVTRLTGELNTVNTSLTKANEDVFRLEKLCQLKGIDPKQAVTQEIKSQTEKKTIGQWEAEMNAAKTPEARSAISTAFEKAVKDKQIATA